MLETLNQIDSSIFLFFNGMHTPFLDRFMMLFTDRFIWIPMYASILIVLFKTQGVKSTLLYAIFLSLAIVLTDQTCATYIRPMVERLRPSNLENPLSALALVVDDYRGGNYGFPSCHAANSFALATFLTLLYSKRKIGLFILGWALMNSYTRLYLGVHYPGDLFVGACIGCTYGLLSQRMATFCNKALTKSPNNEAVSKLSDTLLHIPLPRLPFPQSSNHTSINISTENLLIAVGFITTLIIAIISLF